MQENFNASLAIILKEEGGNDDDPRDPGGRTSRGITQRNWNVFRQSHANRPADVWAAADQDVAQIYHDNYWKPYCDQMPSGIDLVFFNTAVNSGRQQAVKELQRSLGVAGDGMMGMITFNALDAYHDIPRLIRDLCQRRRNFYRALETFKYFGRGWLARTDRIEKAALRMAAMVPAKTVTHEYPKVDTKPNDPKVTVSPKAPVTDKAEPTISPETAGGLTAGSGTLTGTLSEIQNQLQPFSGTIKHVQYALLILTVIGIGYTIFALIKRRRVAKAVSE